MTTKAKPGVCRSCGAATSGSRYATQCGSCGRRRAAEAQLRDHRYTRTHVHEWADGRKTIEAGTTCECDEEVGA